LLEYTDNIKMFDRDLIAPQNHSVCLELSRGKTRRLLALNKLNNRSVLVGILTL